MVIFNSNTQSLSAEDLKEIAQFQSQLKRCIATGLLFADDLDLIVMDIPANRKVIIQKLELARQLIWENLQTGDLTLAWQPYRKS